MSHKKDTKLKWVNFSLLMAIFMQITFSYSLGPDQDHQNVGPDQHPDCLHTSGIVDVCLSCLFALRP